MKQLATNYVFDVSEKTVQLTGLNVPVNYILVIINSRRNKVIYNLAKPELGYEEYTQGTNSVIKLKANLEDMEDTDPLTIFYDNGSPSETILVQGPIGPTGPQGVQGPPGTGGDQSLYNTSIGDSVTSVAVGGSPAGTTAQTWKTRTIVQVLDTILFPDLDPTYIAPTLITTINVNNSVAYEIGQTVNVKATLTGTKNDAGLFGAQFSISRTAIQQNSLVGTEPANWLSVTDVESPTSGWLQPQYGFNNPNAPQKIYVGEWQEDIVLGPSTYTWYGEVFTGYAAGLPKKNNKGVTDPRTPALRTTTAPQSAQTSTWQSSNSNSITPIYPWFWGKSTTEPTAESIAGQISTNTNSTKELSSSSGTITVSNFNANNEFIWIAVPTNNLITGSSISIPIKTKWYVSALNNGNIASQKNETTDAFYRAGSAIPVSSPESRWTNVNYNIYISRFPQSTPAPIEFRNS